VKDMIEAVVQKVILNGRHGPYAIATSKDLAGSITFSLEAGVWRENRMPEQGIIVVLADLQKKRAGWRAMLGRFLKPSDEQPKPRSIQK
jgi:hypothetical protein